MFKKISILFCLAASIPVSASPGRSGYVDLSSSKIQLIQGGLSRLYIYNVNMGATSDCDNKTTPVFLFNSGDLGKEIYSMILAAKTAGKRIELVAGSCVNIGSSTYPSISSVSME
jgi:hypothetical protein